MLALRTWGSACDPDDFRSVATPGGSDRVLPNGPPWPQRGSDGLQCIDVRSASNVTELRAFAERFDAFDRLQRLTQLTLGLERDSALVADLFESGTPSVQGH